jgi:hypothetical protein
MNQFSHWHWEDDTMHNYTCGPSMSSCLGPPTTIFWKVKPFAYINDMSIIHIECNQCCLQQIHIIS